MWPCLRQMKQALYNKKELNLVLVIGLKVTLSVILLAI
jgi:hypothetical protein